MYGTVYVYIYLVSEKTLTGFPKGCPIRGQKFRKPLGNLPETYQETLGKPSFGELVSQGFPKRFSTFPKVLHPRRRPMQPHHPMISNKWVWMGGRFALSGVSSINESSTAIQTYGSQNVPHDASESTYSWQPYFLAALHMYPGKKQRELGSQAVHM